MSLLNRRHLLLLPLALAACGFTPAYGPGSAASALLGTVWLDSPKDTADFDFVERVEERLGRPQSRQYDLSYKITTKRVSVGVTSDQRITRYNLTGAVEYRLTRVTDGSLVASGRAESFTGYAATGSTVAGLAAEEDAGLRLTRILADQVVTQLVAQVSNPAARPNVVSGP